MMTTQELLAFGARQYWIRNYKAITAGEIGYPDAYQMHLARMNIARALRDATYALEEAQTNARRVESVSGPTDALAPAGRFPRPNLPPTVYRYRVASGRLVARSGTS